MDKEARKIIKDRMKEDTIRFNRGQQQALALECLELAHSREEEGGEPYEGAKAFYEIALELFNEKFNEGD